MISGSVFAPKSIMAQPDQRMYAMLTVIVEGNVLYVCNIYMPLLGWDTDKALGWFPLGFVEINLPCVWRD